jgi:hypothetical protein
MRAVQESATLSIQATPSAYVALLGINMDQPASARILDLGIEHIRDGRTPERGFFRAVTGRVAALPRRREATGPGDRAILPHSGGGGSCRRYILSSVAFLAP